MGNMNHLHRTCLLFGALISVMGCDDSGFNFDFTHESPEYMIVAEESNKADSLQVESTSLSFSELQFTGGWTTFSFDIGVGEIDPRISGLQVLGVSVLGNNGMGEGPADLSFVERMEIFVIGNDKEPSFLLASYEKKEELMDTSELPLRIHETINLLDYMEEGLEFGAFLQGDRPQRNVAFQTALDFRGFSEKD
jgi:hypothetical protein